MPAHQQKIVVKPRVAGLPLLHALGHAARAEQLIVNQHLGQLLQGDGVDPPVNLLDVGVCRLDAGAQYLQFFAGLLGLKLGQSMLDDRDRRFELADALAVAVQ